MTLRRRRLGSPCLNAGSAGFSLVEMTVALALVSVVVLAVLVPLDRGLRLSLVQPDVGDLDQRLRVASSAIRTALERAGAGLPAGEDIGALTLRWPAVYPHRRGADDVDAPDSAFTDRFTAISASRSGAAPGLSLQMLTGSAPIGFLTGFPCPAADARCGFRPSDLAALDDMWGRAEVFRVTAAGPGVVEHAPAVLAHAYRPADRARVFPVEVRHFRHDAARRQLRAGSGGATEAPVLDDVLAMEVAYVGTSRPPPGPRPPLGVATCLFDEYGVSRLADLPGGAGGLVALPRAAFADGPFCGEGRARYDADLLRVRRVVVRLRLGWTARRGSAGVRSGLEHVAEQREVVVDVVPRNLHPGW